MKREDVFVTDTQTHTAHVFCLCIHKQTRLSPASRHRPHESFTSASRVLHECFTSPSRVLHECFTSASRVLHESFTSSWRLNNHHRMKSRGPASSQLFCTDCLCAGEVTSYRCFKLLTDSQNLDSPHVSAAVSRFPAHL